MTAASLKPVGLLPEKTFFGTFPNSKKNPRPKAPRKGLGFIGFRENPERLSLNN